MLFDVFCLLLNFPLQVGTGLLKALQTHKRMLSRTRLHDTADDREKNIPPSPSREGLSRLIAPCG